MKHDFSICTYVHKVAMNMCAQIIMLELASMASLRSIKLSIGAFMTWVLLSVCV